MGGKKRQKGDGRSSPVKTEEDVEENRRIRRRGGERERDEKQKERERQGK